MLTKQEFGRRLQKLMLDRGLNQSELARRSDIGRDSVSTYIRGRSFPEPKSLNNMAKTLGLSPHELLPNTVASAIDSDNPSLEIKESTGHPGQVWMRLNRLVTSAQALKIMTILQQEPAPAAAKEDQTL